jgi:hypothetical protein
MREAYERGPSQVSARAVLDAGNQIVALKRGSSVNHRKPQLYEINQEGFQDSDIPELQEVCAHTLFEDYLLANCPGQGLALEDAKGWHWLVRDCVKFLGKKHFKAVLRRIEESYANQANIYTVWLYERHHWRSRIVNLGTRRRYQHFKGPIWHAVLYEAIKDSGESSDPASILSKLFGCPCLTVSLPA